HPVVRHKLALRHGGLHSSTYARKPNERLVCCQVVSGLPPHEEIPSHGSFYYAFIEGASMVIMASKVPSVENSQDSGFGAKRSVQAKKRRVGNQYSSPAVAVLDREGFDRILALVR